jgi:hypothetical protein
MEEKRMQDPVNAPSLPPKITMAKNLAVALAKHIADAGKKVTFEQYQERLEICNKCELRLKNRCTHPKCGCFLDIKAWWASEQCPYTPPKWPGIGV